MKLLFYTNTTQHYYTHFYFLLLLLFCSLASNNAFAQSVYETQFANPNSFCDEGLFCTTIQIRAASSADDFAMGAHTFFGNYNAAAINYPSYESINFGNSSTCTTAGNSPYSESISGIGFDPVSGEFNMSTNMSQPNMGCPTITTDWVDVGTLCFSILDVTQTTGLSFNPQLTVVNLNENLPMHEQGTLLPLDVLVSCGEEFGDSDDDGLSNAIETSLGTDPNNPDSDEDGLLDGEEVNTYNTEPLVDDTDGDGLPDGAEVFIYFSDPAITDTDDDGLDDNEETLTGTNPNLADTDGDGLTDGEEVALETFPINPDSDDDGLTDGEEVNTYDTNPLINDSDGDGLQDGEEVNEHNTNPNASDSDDDGLADITELAINTNPLIADTDEDGLLDGEEANVHQTNPLNADSDEDGVEDGTEVGLDMNPLEEDSDYDTVPDGVELADGVAVDTDDDGLINPLDADDDGDDIFTFDEDANNNGDPTDDDTDNDGIPDYLDYNPTGISDIANSINMVAYPNPMVDKLQIQLNNPALLAATTQIVLYNINGQIVHQEKMSPSGTHFVAVNHLASGIYLVVLQVEGQNIKQQKVLKQ